MKNDRENIIAHYRGGCMSVEEAAEQLMGLRIPQYTDEEMEVLQTARQEEQSKCQSMTPLKDLSKEERTEKMKFMSRSPLVFKGVGLGGGVSDIRSDYQPLFPDGPSGQVLSMKSGETAWKNDVGNAVKHDEEKTRYGLIPHFAIDDVARVFTYGAVKYGDHNWRGGMKWSRMFDACLRHVYAFWRGEKLDKESNLPHLAHAIACLLILSEYDMFGKGENDRVMKGADS